MDSRCQDWYAGVSLFPELEKHMAKARGNKLVPPANYSRNPMSTPPNQGPVKPYRFDPNLGGSEQLARYAEYARSYGQSPYDPSMSETSNEILFGKNPQNIGIRQDLPTPRANYTRNPMQNMGGPSPRATYRGSPLGPNPLGEQVRETIDRNSPSVRVRPGWLDEPIPLATPGVPQRTAPSVNIWNGGAMQRSPSPMTYADPSNDPNIGMYDLARQVDALRERSQTKFPSNPMSPTYGVVNPDAESARRLAPMMARDAARQQNTPMNGMTAYEANPLRLRPDQKLNLAEQNAGRLAAGGAASDPTGMAGRFNPMADQINSQANAVANGRGWYLGGQFVGATGNPQWGTAENMRRRVDLNNAPQQATQEQRDSNQARRAGIHRQFMDENNGMNYLQARRADRKEALRERSFKKAVTRGLNPMSPEAQALFPQQVAKMKGQTVAQPNQNPMVQAFEPGAQNTPEGNALRDQMKVQLAQNSPSLNAIGVSGETDPNTFAGSLASYKGDLTDEGLTEIHNFAKTYAGGEQGASPFDNAQNTMAAPEMIAELWKMPIGTPPQKLREWFNKYRQETQSRLDRAKQNMQSSPAWTVG